MDSTVESVLREYEKRAESEFKMIRELSAAEMMRRRDEFLLSIGPGTGQLLNTLIKEANARSILEIGTSYGYSGLWLAEAARATGGRVITLDVHPGKQEFARGSLRKAGLADFVEFRLGDARESIKALSGPFDFVLLDLWKDLYVPCFDLFYPKLSAGALVAADNMIFPEASRKEAAAYRRHVRASKDIQSMLLPVGSGIELSRYVKGLELA